LSATALTSLNRVKQWLGQDPVASDQDDRLTWLINAASSAVSQYAGRQFASEGSATHTFRVQGGWPKGAADFAPFDASAITTVTLADMFGNTQLLSSQYYQPRPVHKPNGVYTRLAFLWAPIVLPYAQSVAVLGTWGFASVPADVENAVIITAAKWFQRDQNTATPEYVYPGGTTEDLSLPYDARMLMVPYRRPVV
jgi:hypothetical protein